MMEIKIKRIYEKFSPKDGLRILVDRLWPRGIKKEEAKIDLWFKEIAPSDKLRKWFKHDVSKWEEFKKRYKEEIEQNKESLEKLIEIIKKKRVVTLVFSAKDKEHNNAVILREVLKRHLGSCRIKLKVDLKFGK
jgi:uncharacterized protein YeaO (DUF488 family)